MASQGPNSGATFASVAPGDIVWDTPTNAQTSDNAYAQAIFTAVLDQSSENLHATNFGFLVPAGSTIDGIIAEVERKSTNVAADIRDLSVKIIKGGTASGDEKASGTIWPASDTYQTYGTASDKWGLTWTSTDINASNFGLSISAGDFIALPWIGQIDHIRLTVHYTPASSSKLMLLGVG